MRASDSCKGLAIALVLLVQCGFTAPHARADAGGGSGRPLTPYNQDEQLTEARVSAVRAEAAMRRSINSGIKIRNTNVEGFGDNVAFMFVKDNAPISPPSFTLTGATQAGEKLEVNLSELASFRILEYEDRWIRSDRLLLEVTIFPAISPAELLAKRPTYSELENRYTKSVLIWVEIESKGAELSLTRRDRFSDKNEVIARLRDVEAGHYVQLDYSFSAGPPPIWWAIESVIADAKYPFRFTAAK